MIEPKQISHAAQGSWITHEYATICPWNRDNSKLLLVHQNHFELYDGDGNWLKSLPLSADSEPRWTHDPNMLYYRWNNEVRIMDVRTDVSVTLRTFIGFTKVNGRGEADVSEDGNHLALCGDDRTVFLYNARTDKVSQSLEWSQPFDSLYVTPDNQLLVGQIAGGVFLSNGRKVSPSLAHQDVCRDVNGDPVLIRTNAGDPAADLISGCPNGIEKVNLASGERRCIWPLGYSPLGGPKSQAVHISCPDKAGWALVSTYSPSNSDPSLVYKVPFDGSGPQLLCETKSIMPPTDLYNATPKASVSRDGSRFIFASNNGVMTRGVHYVDVFLVKLEKAVDSVPPTPAPAPQPAPQPQPVPAPTPIQPEATENPWERIDYAPYFQAGWQYLWEPRADGAIDVYQRKKKGR